MMYVEFIGILNVPIEAALAPDILCDPDIKIISIVQAGPVLDNVRSPDGYACLLHVFISDEDALYLRLKYPDKVSNIFTKVDK